MKCPACGHGLSARTVSDLTVDVCEGGCGGVWFDNFELQKVDEPHESLGESLLDIPRNERLAVDHSERRGCPKCENIVMMRHHFTVKREVEVDTCPGCAGVWLDSGELAAIRAQFSSEDERKKAAQACFKDLFDSQLAEMESQSKEQQARAQSFARVFRFLLPSYWIPGKQDWGAY